MQVIKRATRDSAVSGFEKRYLVENPSMRCALMHAQRGTDIVRHSHSSSSEVFIVVSGSCTLTAGGSAAQLSAGDVATVAPGEAHYFQIGPDEDLTLVAVVAPNLDDAVIHTAEEMH